MSRVLKKGGKIIMLEPAMGILPRFIYYLFHKEPNGFETSINWGSNIDNKNLNNYSFAAQSIPWRIFYSDKNIKKLKEFNLKIEKVEIFSDFTYLLSGGYSFRPMYPSILFDILIKLDKFLTLIGKNLFSARMFIVLKKE